MWKLRLREMKRQIRAHTAGKWQIKSKLLIGSLSSKSSASLRPEGKKCLYLDKLSPKGFSLNLWIRQRSVLKRQAMLWRLTHVSSNPVIGQVT